jgi:hypothetical protein
MSYVTEGDVVPKTKKKKRQRAKRGKSSARKAKRGRAVQGFIPIPVEYR